VNQVGIKGVKVATRPGTKSRKENMLKFLTHKLRTHSINEDNYVEKVCIPSEIEFVTILTSLKVISE
jgi:hypothetical protein